MHFERDGVVLCFMLGELVIEFGLFGYFVTGGSPTFVLTLGGIQLPLPVLQWSERTERT